MTLQFWSSGIVPNHIIRGRALIIIAAAVALINPAYGSPSQVDLDDAIRRTINLNPVLKQYPLRHSVLRAREQTANLKPALKFGAEIENIFGTGSYSDVTAAETTLSLFSVLERGGKRAARINEIKQQVNATALERRQAVTNLAADVTKQFIIVAAAQEAEAIQRTAVQLQQRIEKEVRKRVNAGAAPDAELLRVRAALADSEGALTAANSLLTIERNKLSSFWLAEGNSAYWVSAALYQLPEPFISIEIDELVEDNPEVALLTQRIIAQEAVTRSIEANSSADIGWRLAARNFSETNDMAFSVGVELPLFSDNRNRGDVAESQLEQQQLQLQREQAVWAFKRRLQELNRRLKASNANVKTLSGDVLPLQQKALTETQLAYNRGRYSFAELAAEQRRLNQLQQRILKAATRSHQINIELERLLGQTVPNSPR